MRLLRFALFSTQNLSGMFHGYKFGGCFGHGLFLWTGWLDFHCFVHVFRHYFDFLNDPCWKVPSVIEFLVLIDMLQFCWIVNDSVWMIAPGYTTSRTLFIAILRVATLSDSQDKLSIEGWTKLVSVFDRNFGADFEYINKVPQIDSWV